MKHFTTLLLMAILAFSATTINKKIQANSEDGLIVKKAIKYNITQLELWKYQIVGKDNKQKVQDKINEEQKMLQKSYFIINAKIKDILQDYSLLLSKNKDNPKIQKEIDAIRLILEDNKR